MSMTLEDVSTWLRIDSSGCVGLRRGMSEAELTAALGTVREGFLPAPHLRLFEHFASAVDGATVEAVLFDERLGEVRANVHVYSVADRKALLDGITAELDRLGARQGGKWTFADTTFQLRASAADVLEEGMPVVVTLTVTWPREGS